ncbi:MAG: cupin domain-containing protein [Pirellulales bacterium]|nr:cupin domain-containing protein [Pirellulales bacterium]
MTTTLAIQTGSLPTDTLPDMPLEKSQITNGNPIARGAISCQTEDKKVSSGYWSCTQGEFNWEFSWDEFVHILEGEVIITEDGGSSYTLKANDTAHFPLGLKTHWEIVKDIKKFFVVRTSEPLELE